MLQHSCKIGCAVCAVFVCSKVQANNPRSATRCKAICDNVHTLVVKSKAIDRCLILGQTKQARAWVAGLGSGGGRTYLDKSKTAVPLGVTDLGIFVKARGQSDRVGHVEAGHMCPKSGGCYR